jgi:hypothetical protein
VFGNVVDQQCTNCATIISAMKEEKKIVTIFYYDFFVISMKNLRRGDGTVSLLSCRIPDLSFNRLAINLYKSNYFSINERLL